MNSFGNWQKFLDKSLELLCNCKNDLKGFESSTSDEDRIRWLEGSAFLRDADWIEDYLSDVIKIHSLKSVEASADYRNKGNLLCKKKKFNEALEMYNESVLSAPVPCRKELSSELSLAYANRSALFYETKEYEKCLVDIELALSAGYLLESHKKLYDRRELCQKYLANTSQKEESNELKSSGLDVSPVYGRNNMLTCASSAVEMKFSKEKGRHLVANRSISAGSVLIVERPYVFILLPDHWDTRCYHCLAQLSSVVGCRRCCVVRYCSETCREESWSHYHSVECYFSDVLLSVGVAHLALRIVLTAGLEFLTKFSEKLKSDLSDDPLSQSADYVYCSDYRSVYDLMSHTEHMHTEDLFQYSLTAQLLLKCLDKSNFFKSSKCSTEKESSEERIFIGSLLLRHICQLVCNAHAITDIESSAHTSSKSGDSFISQTSQQRIATAIYPTASLMNHSCDPTIISGFDKDTLIVRAVKDVKSSDEIFNCYGPHCKRMRREERQQSLSEQYFFTCRCTACDEEQDQELMWMAWRCSSCSGACVQSKSDDSSLTCRDCGRTTQIAKNQEVELDQAQRWFDEAVRLMKQNNCDDALQRLRKCCETQEKLLHRYNRTLSNTEDALAMCLISKGQFNEAEVYLSRSLSTVEQIYGAESVELAHELQKYSELCSRAGPQSRAKALRAVDRAMTLFELHYGPDYTAMSELLQLKLYLVKLK